MIRKTTALFSLSLFVLFSDAHAAQNPFVGNTIRASYTVIGKSCTKFGCKDIRQEFRDTVYIDAGGKTGEVNTNDARQTFTVATRALEQSGQGVMIFRTWSIEGDKLINRGEFHTSNPVNPNGQVGIQRVIYSAVGSKCLVAWIYDPVPGFTFQTSVALHGCDILRGHAGQ